jgi:hypothetical protein
MMKLNINLENNGILFTLKLNNQLLKTTLQFLELGSWSAVYWRDAESLALEMGKIAEEILHLEAGKVFISSYKFECNDIVYFGFVGYITELDLIDNEQKNALEAILTNFCASVTVATNKNQGEMELHSVFGYEEILSKHINNFLKNRKGKTKIESPMLLNSGDKSHPIVGSFLPRPPVENIPEPLFVQGNVSGVERDDRIVNLRALGKKIQVNFDVDKYLVRLLDLIKSGEEFEFKIVFIRDVGGDLTSQLDLIGNKIDKGYLL